MSDGAVDRPLISTVRDELQALAQPARAPQMQAYMKSAMPYLGVRVPRYASSCGRPRETARPRTLGGLAATVRALWYEARYREERYAATGLLNVTAARALRHPRLADLYAELIVSGAWWDHVDDCRTGSRTCWSTSPRRCGPRSKVGSASRTCGCAARRSSVSWVLGSAPTSTCSRARSSPTPPTADFFIRKAIGWALRDYARTDAAWVRRFVAAHELSPLSRREALKHDNSRVRRQSGA